MLPCRALAVSRITVNVGVSVGVQTQRCCGGLLLVAAAAFIAGEALFSALWGVRRHRH